MMLEITLLGQPQIHLNGAPLQIKSRKAQALLFYLVTDQRPHSREKLAGIFWEDMDLERARNNLSGILSKDLRALRDVYVVATPDFIAFNKDSEHKVDIHPFQDRFGLQNAPLQTFETLASAYHGQFLEDFVVPTVPEFEYWRTGQQERFHSLAYPVFNTLIWHHHQGQNWNQGIQLVQHLLNAHPTDEKARRLMMLLLFHNEQRVTAMEHYETYYEMLANEGNRPTQETIKLYGAIIQNKLDETLLDRYTQPRYTPTITPLPTDEPADDAIPFQAERQVPHFVGRENELQTIADAITDPEADDILCLVGMGGVGKTTLAIRLAHDLREGFADGVLWAKLAASDPFSVLESWAQAYNLDYSQLSDLESRAAAFRDFLEDKQTLLILDDVRRTSQVKPLLPNGEKCTVLITTRDAAIANVFNAQAIPLSVFEHQTSLDLLAELLTPERMANELDAAAEIADLLEHLPLALEITAKRLRSRPWSLAQTADRLRSVKSRLDELNLRDIAVRATFEDSWTILTEEQQRFFAYLGIFGEREFQIDALRTITELDNFTTEDFLFDLVELSLVFTDGEWFWLHSLLADFAGEKLDVLGEADDAQQRMAGYYLDFVYEHQGDPTPLNNHWHNIMAGVQFAYDHHMWQACIDYAENLYDAFFTQGHFTDARGVYPLALEAARALDEQESLVDLLCSLARACIEQSNYDEARTYLNESLTISQQLEYPRGIGEATYYMSRIDVVFANNQDAFNSIEGRLKYSREIFEELGDQAAIGRNLYAESNVFYYHGDYDTAEKIVKESLTNYEEINDTLGVIRSLSLLASIQLNMNRYEDCNLSCQQALQLCDEIQDQTERPGILYMLAEVCRMMNAYNDALSHAQDGIQLLNRTGNQRGLALTLRRLGVIYRDMRHYDSALQTLEESLHLTRRMNYLRATIDTLYSIGRLYEETEQINQACHHWQQAKSLIQGHHRFLDELNEKINQYECLSLGTSA